MIKIKTMKKFEGDGRAVIIAAGAALIACGGFCFARFQD